MNSGRIMRDEEHEENKKKTENGNNSNGNGNGNGDSNGSSDGGGIAEGWSAKYKKSIDCNNPKGFSQRAHCQGRKKMNEAKNGDHEVSMAQSQLKNSAENIAKLRKKLGKRERDIPAWMQAKITDTEHNTDAAASYVDKISEARDGKSAKDKDYSLRDWFAGGGWVQAGGKYDGKPCAKQPGQKTKPFCRDADDRAAMSKEERNKRAKKKRKEDPNPNRKGKAKMVREQIDTSGQSFNSVFVQAVKNAGGRREDAIPSIPKSANSKTKIKKESYSNWREELAEGKPYQPGEEIPDSATKPQNKKPKFSVDVNKTLAGPENRLSNDPIIRRAPKGTASYSNVYYDEETKKDACYKKVKARYDVWPSAYASGALSKCRKVGAANWGNSTKKEGYEFSNWRDDFKAMEFEFVDIIKTEPMKGLSEEKLDKCEKNKIEKYIKGMKKNKGSFNDNYGSDSKSVMYATATNMAKKACKEEFSDWRTQLGEDWQKVNRGDKTDGMSQKAVNAYKRENPGSKLQTAVTEKKPSGKRAKRRKSFCARSNGQRKMHNIDCSKTPEKKICKARKRWNCE